MSKNWLQRLREGLSKSSGRMTIGLSGLLTGGKLNEDALNELEDALLTADLGPRVAAQLRKSLIGKSFSGGTAEEEARIFLAEKIAGLLEPVAKPLAIHPNNNPHIILVTGINGVGKTTSIGKLAHTYRQQGLKVMLAAGDTFRAAAVEQLQIWGQRTGCPVVARDTGADAAGLAWDAIEQARAERMDLLLIDTAGRLHNKSDLMAELQKVIRVIHKLDETAPHDTLLVLDASTGQNALSQVETFREMVAVSGLILTKLDGTARGGVLVSLAERFGLPVHAVGVGEGVDDLHPFDATVYARTLMGLM